MTLVSSESMNDPLSSTTYSSENVGGRGLTEVVSDIPNKKRSGQSGSSGRSASSDVFITRSASSPLIPCSVVSRSELALGLADHQRSSVVGKLFRPTVAFCTPLVHGGFCNRGGVDRSLHWDRLWR